MIEHVEYDYEELNRKDRLFPSRMVKDHSILYHATTSLDETGIENSGFGGCRPLVTAPHVDQMMALYRSMNWEGLHSDGYAALDQATGRFALIDTPHAWFRETAMRSLLYAERDWAGGELVRAFRIAYADLVEFLGSEDVRQKHLHRQSQRPNSPVIRVDTARLAAKLSALRQTAETAEDLTRQYKYGLVYAVRFVEEDIPNLFYNRRSGILHRGVLAPDRIVGKARLPLGSRMAPRRDDYGRMFSWCEGPFGAKIRTNQPDPVSRGERQIEQPEWLGDDVRA